MQDATNKNEALPAQHRMPFVRFELAVLGLVDGALSVLLARRAAEPFAGRWAMPGGVLRIDLERDLDDGVQRVARERLGLELPFVRQLVAVGSRDRDPRAPWAISLVYRALVSIEAFAAAPGKRIEALNWRPVDQPLPGRQMAFDHAGLVAAAVSATRAEVDSLLLPSSYLPAEFTLAELQGICEGLLGRRLDKSSFRRKLEDRALVEPVEGKLVAGGAHRPAQVFRLRG